MNLKFLFPLLGLAVGIWLAADFFPNWGLPAVTAGLAFLCWVLTTVISKDPVRGMKYSYLHLVWISLIFLAIGSSDYIIRSKTIVNGDPTIHNLIYKSIIKDIVTQADGDKFRVKVIAVKDSTGRNWTFRNLNLLLKTDGFSADKGEVIEFNTRLTKISDFSKNKTSTYRLKHQGFEYKANVKRNKIRKLNEVSYFYFTTNQIRDKIIILIENSSLNRKTSEFIISLLLGDKSLLSSDTRQTLSNAGMAHILALSGMHVAIILSIVSFLLFPLCFFGKNSLRKILAVSILWIYVIFTGAAPSTVRAAIMATFIVGAFILQRKNSALNALMAAVLFILIWNPLFLWDIGLQLSFLCVVAILLFAEKLNPISQHEHPKSYKSINIVLISLISTFATWVLIGYYFGRIPTMFLASNVLLLPFLPIFVAMSFVYIGFLIFNIDISFLSWFLDLYHKYFIGAAETLSFGNRALVNLNVPLGAVFAWLVALVAMAIAFHSPKKIISKFTAIGACLAILISVAYVSFQVNNQTTSLKFVHSFNKLEAHLIKNGKIQYYNFPRGSLAQLRSDQFHILSIDNTLSEEDLNKLQVNNTETQSSLFKSYNPNYYLFIGANADLEQTATLINNSYFNKVVLHSGIGKKKKALLMSLLEDDNLDKIHSLGENGSLEFSL